jgi:hypothetical protein
MLFLNAGNRAEFDTGRIAVSDCGSESGRDHEQDEDVIGR